METFQCPNLCTELCANRHSSNTSQLSSLIDVAGLTKDELALAARQPAKAKIVYEQKGIAEEMTQKRFKRDWYDDESDAYRHFIWTGLLIKELGREWAQKFLDAHEAALPPNDPSVKMDQKNNKVAIKYAERLQKAGKLNAESLDKEALGALKRKELMVIRSMGDQK